MPSLTHRATDCALFIKDLVVGQAGALGMDALDIYYGDQQAIPRYPSITIEPGPTSREDLDSVGLGFRSTNIITVMLLVYWQQIIAGEGKQFNDKEGDIFAENVADILNANTTLDGLVHWGHVTLIEPGYAVRARTPIRTSRLTWQGTSKTRLV